MKVNSNLVMPTVRERKKWERKEIILAINLYCKIPFGKIHSGNPDIIELAKLIGRTANAVSWKLANFAHLDPSLQRVGASNVSHLDRKIWDEFFNNWNELSFESERILRETRFAAATQKDKLENIRIPEGKEKRQLVKSRVNQNFFRKTVLSSYDFTCCITGITELRLLMASHIVPWKTDKANRTNPRNGLCLNALHDKAFDSGLLTLENDGKIKLSSVLKKATTVSTREYFLKYEGEYIREPKRFFPQDEFLNFHRNRIFIE